MNSPLRRSVDEWVHFQMKKSWYDGGFPHKITNRQSIIVSTVGSVLVRLGGFEPAGKMHLMYIFMYQRAKNIDKTGNSNIHNFRIYF